MTRTEALTHAIQEINRHWNCSGRSPAKHQPALDILLAMRTEEHPKQAEAGSIASAVRRVRKAQQGGR